RMKMLDYTSSVLLNSFSGAELKRIESPKATALFALFDSGKYPTDGNFFDLVQRHGIGVFTVVQAHYLKKMADAAFVHRDSVREKWVDAIIAHAVYGVKKFPEKKYDLIEDAIYSLTRAAYNAALNDNYNHARDVINLAIGHDMRLDQFDAQVVKA